MDLVSFEQDDHPLASRLTDHFATRMGVERNPWFRVLIVLLVLIAGLYLLGRVWEIAAMFADIILMFFLAWLLAFILKPIARLLCTYTRVPWPAAVAVVFVGLLVVLAASSVVLVPILALQLAQLSDSLPLWTAEFPDLVASIQAFLLDRGIPVDLERWYQIQDLPSQIERVGTPIIQNTLGLLTGVASAVFSAIIVLILSFYLLLDGDRIADEALRLVPAPHQQAVVYLLDSIERTFGGFLRGQLVQAIIYGAGTAAVMLVAGTGYVVALSLFAGVVMFIPFFGPFLALIPPLLVSLFQLPISGVILVLVALLALQQLVLNILAPKIMSESVGIHPLLVFLAVLAGAKMAGLAGAVFGVPIVGVLNAMLWHFYHQSDTYRAKNQAASTIQPVAPSGSQQGLLRRVIEISRGLFRTLTRQLPRER